jgi:hypothetical protein
VDFWHKTIVFKTDLSNTNIAVDLKKEFEFDTIRNTNDLVGLDKSFKRLIYFNLYIDEEASSPVKKVLKLKLFTNSQEDPNVLRILVKKNFLFVLKRQNYQITVYDLNKVKKNSCFSLRQFYSRNHSTTNAFYLKQAFIAII